MEEVAADIFMGRFTNKFIEVARRAAKALAGTLYARCYGIDTDAVAALADTPTLKTQTPWARHSPRASDALAILCARRVGAELGTYHPATNGTILEQQQILTTQNLAPLFCELGLNVLLHDRLGKLALTCFEWICARQQTPADGYHARLIMLKNTGYAWRQMMFYLSLLDEPGRQSALEDIEVHFESQPIAFRDRFLPGMIGLRMAAAGQGLPQGGVTAEGARVLLGWSVEPHWLFS